MSPVKLPRRTLLGLITAPLISAPLISATVCLSAERRLAAADGDDSEVVKAWLSVCDKQAADFVIASASAPDKPFRRIEAPVFRHAQPARGNDVGAVWVWVDEASRPVAIGDIFAWSVNDAPDRNVTHEFHSLADMPLAVRYGDSPCWQPEKGGLEWKPVPDAPAPGKTRADRLRQARDLARGFSANTVDFKQSRWELRLVPRPVHQYDADGERPAVSGGLFALCQGTDPELWLAIETRSVGAERVWHYAFASFTDYSVQARHGADEVWSCPKYVHGIRTLPHYVQSVAVQVSLPGAKP